MAGALTVCSDGNLQRPSVCGVTAITALDTPTKPLDVRMRSVGASKVSMAWDRPSDTGDGSSSFPLVGFQIEYYQEGAEADTLVQVSVTDGLLSFTTPEIVLGEIYKGRVRAVNDADASEWSEYMQARALLRPDAPGTVQALNRGNLIIAVEWTRPAQTGLGPGREWTMAKYQLLINASSCGDHRQIDLAEDVTSFAVENVLEGCAYLFRVRALNEAGFSPYQNSSEVRGLSLASSVQNLVARTPRALEVRLDWEKPKNSGDGTDSSENVVVYEVEAAVGSLATADFSATLRKYAVRTPGVLVTLLEQDVLYSFVVRARNLAGLGGIANVSATPMIPSIQGVSVLPSSNLAGDNISLTVDFTLATDFDVDDQIVISFPVHFSLLSASAFSNTLSLNTRTQEGAKLCGYRCVPSMHNLFLSRQFVGTPSGDVVSAGSLMSIRLEGIVNRRWEGPSGVFQIRTVESVGNYTTSEALNVTGYSFVAGPLGDPTAKLGAKNTGEVTTLSVAFRSVRNPLPSNAIFRLVVASDMIPDGVLGMAIVFQGQEQALSVSVENQKISGSRDGGAEIPPNTTITISIEGIRNRLTEGSSGTFSLEILTGFDALMDTSTDIGAIDISAGLLNDATLDLDEYRTFASTKYRFSFRLGAVGLPGKSMQQTRAKTFLFDADACGYRCVYIVSHT